MLGELETPKVHPKSCFSPAIKVLGLTHEREKQLLIVGSGDGSSLVRGCTATALRRAVGRRKILHK